MSSLPLLGYIDPASGSLLLQIVIAGFVGALAFFRRSVFHFFGFFKRSKKNEEPVENKKDK